MGVRPRIQRCFLGWLKEVEPRLDLPLRQICRTDQALVLGFKGVTPALSITLSRYDPNVWVNWRGTCWDAIFSEYVSAQRTPEGCLCAACPGDMRKLWPSREVLWREHLFEPFLKWVNGTLAHSEMLAMYGEESGRTWAFLRSTEQLEHLAEAQFVVPVRMPGRG